ASIASKKRICSDISPLSPASGRRSSQALAIPVWLPLPAFDRGASRAVCPSISMAVPAHRLPPAAPLLVAMLAAENDISALLLAHCICPPRVLRRANGIGPDFSDHARRPKPQP